MSDQKTAQVFRAGERIVTEGETGNNILILMKGEVSVWRGKTELSRVRGQGDILGELASLTGKPRSASIIAVTDVEMLSVKVEFHTFSKMHPEILEKIDSTIKFRFEIAGNKTNFYCKIAAQARSLILYEALLNKEIQKSGKLQKDKENQIIKKVRKILDEEFELHQTDEDPRILKKIADTHGILTDYSIELQKQVWTDESLYNRFNEINDSFKISNINKGLTAIRERAKLTMEMIDLLNEFENTPGAQKHMDIAKLEEIIPFEARAKALYEVVKNKSEDKDVETLSYLNKKVQETIEKQKLASGSGNVLVSRSAKELKVLTLYEEELRRIMDVSETRSTFVDLMPVSR